MIFNVPLKTLTTRSFAVLCLFLLAWPAHAGTVGKIAGKVIDAENKEPVIGANVIIEGTTQGAAADVDGEFFILNVPPGFITIRVSALGYAPETVRNVQVTSDQTTNLDFKLRSQSIEGEEVTIVAERNLVEADRTFSTSTVAARDIDALPVTDIGQVVDIQAGVVDGHFRGGRKAEVLYLVDGVSVTDVYDNSQGTQVDQSVVEELQVISGTFNAEYGQAMSGVVNLVTKEGGDQYHGMISSEWGDYISNHTDIFTHIGAVSPLAIQDYSATLEGPVPGTRNRLRFFLNGRYQTDSGWMYGQRRWGLAWPLIPISEQFVNPGNGSEWPTLVAPSGDTLEVLPLQSGQVLLASHGDNEWVEMNPNLERWGNAKLTYDVGPAMKLNFQTLSSSRIYRDYSQDRRFVPDGNLRRYRDGRTNMLRWNHTVNARMFYELGLTNSFTEYHHFAYKNIYDSRYLVPDYNDIEPAYVRGLAGVDMNRFRRWTNTNELTGAISAQATKLHLLKAGFDAKFHKLFYEDINLDEGLVELTELPISQRYGFPLYQVQFSPVISDISTRSHDRYSNTPSELAFYVQDKIELASLIVNLGLRWDYFDPDGHMPADPKDPNVYAPVFQGQDTVALSTRMSYWYKDAKAKQRISPRLGIAFPMSDKGVMHFSYGHFVQRPTFERMYANPEWEMEPGVGLNTQMGNPDLKMEETVSYEFGFQQQVAQDIALNTSIFSRDIRNLVASDLIVETYSSGTKYSQYVNRSFGEVKGITLGIDKRYSNNLSAFLDYTYQVARGDASDPQSAYNASRGEHPREPEKQLVPLDWDRRHTVNASFSYAVPGKEGWGVTLLGKYGSGLPYTPTQQGIRTGFANDGRKPEYYNVDLSAFKSFSFGRSLQQKITLLLTVQNLLDTENENNVYTDTGRAGYSQEELSAVERPYLNTLDEYYTDPGYYSRPRLVRVGLKMEF